MEMLLAFTDLYAAGLENVFQTFVQDYLIWIFLFAVVAFSIVFIKDRSWLKLGGFLAIAIVIGLIIWNARYLFGTQGEGGVGLAEDITEQL